ncbi:MAG: hypothetical protein QOH28_1465 [Actinomycetota bacterium]|jgi:hypothetical protein|nr:hypothetical protein [Actinomycetota bacterium]
MVTVPGEFARNNLSVWGCVLGAPPFRRLNRPGILGDSTFEEDGANPDRPAMPPMNPALGGIVVSGADACVWP